MRELLRLSRQAFLRIPYFLILSFLVSFSFSAINWSVGERWWCDGVGAFIHSFRGIHCVYVAGVFVCRYSLEGWRGWGEEAEGEGGGNDIGYGA